MAYSQRGKMIPQHIIFKVTDMKARYEDSMQEEESFDTFRVCDVDHVSIISENVNLFKTLHVSESYLLQHTSELFVI